MNLLPERFDHPGGRSVNPLATLCPECRRAWADAPMDAGRALQPAGVRICNGAAYDDTAAAAAERRRHWIAQWRALTDHYRRLAMRCRHAREGEPA